MDHFIITTLDDTIMVPKNCPIIGEHGIILVTLYVTMATVWPAKNTLNIRFLKALSFQKRHGETHSLLSNFDEKDKMQLFAKV